MATFVAFPGRVDAGTNELSLQSMVSYIVCGAQCKMKMQNPLLEKCCRDSDSRMLSQV